MVKGMIKKKSGCLLRKCRSGNGDGHERILDKSVFRFDRLGGVSFIAGCGSGSIVTIVLDISTIARVE